MDERDVVLRHYAKVVVRAPHAVGRVAAIVQKPGSGEVRDRRLAVAADAIFVFAPRLADMHVQSPPELAVRGG